MAQQTRQSTLPSKSRTAAEGDNMVVASVSAGDEVNKVKAQVYSFEEYKMYYESAEKVTDRRLSINKANYSIGTAILLGIGAAWAWSIANSSYTFMVLSVSAVLSLVAVIFTSLWIDQVKDYKSLNAAKFEVLNEMSHGLAFGDKENALNLVSYSPFEKEWTKLQASKAVRKGRFYHIVALSSSDLEFFVPRCFRIIFAVVFMLSILPLLWRWDLFFEVWRKFLHF